jgi:hypothetical protein
MADGPSIFSLVDVLVICREIADEAHEARLDLRLEHLERRLSRITLRALHLADSAEKALAINEAPKSLRRQVGEIASMRAVIAANDAERTAARAAVAVVASAAGLHVDEGVGLVAAIEAIGARGVVAPLVVAGEPPREWIERTPAMLRRALAEGMPELVRIGVESGVIPSAGDEGDDGAQVEGEEDFEEAMSNEARVLVIAELWLRKEGVPVTAWAGASRMFLRVEEGASPKDFELDPVDESATWSDCATMGQELAAKVTAHLNAPRS